MTNGPGLIGALLVGVQAAKAIAFARGLPIVGVNHLVGHLLSAQLVRPGDATRPPGVAVHRAVSRAAATPRSTRCAARATSSNSARRATMPRARRSTRLRSCSRSAIRADRASTSSRRKAMPGACACRGRCAGAARLEFSFSGLKTAVAQHLRAHGRPEREQDVADLCASFQQVVVESLVDKCVAACEQRARAAARDHRRRGVQSRPARARTGALRRARHRAARAAAARLHRQRRDDRLRRRLPARARRERRARDCRCSRAARSWARAQVRRRCSAIARSACRADVADARTSACVAARAPRIISKGATFARRYSMLPRARQNILQAIGQHAARAPESRGARRRPPTSTSSAST